MKAGAFFLCLLWLAAATFAGYLLTERSFAWVDLPNFGLPAPATNAAVEPAKRPLIPQIDLNALKSQIPPQYAEKAKSLTPGQLLCLKASISPDHIQAALQGRLTSAEAAAVNNCLK